MKALSLKQPWANFICERKKTIETRVWKDNYRGDILICSSKTADKEWEKYLDSFFEPPFGFNLDPKGMAICIVELYDIKRMTKEDEKAAMCEVYKLGNRYAQSFFLRNIRPIKPFPVRGQLGIFDIDIDPEKIIYL